MRISWRKLNNLIDHVFHRLQEDPPTGVSGAPTDNNIMIWNAVIFGPHDTPFEDGTFKLTIEFTEEYPNKPPTVRFVSKMFHPNVYADGGICLDILQNRWSPTYDVSAILTSIQVICNRFATKPIYQRPLTIIIDFSFFFSVAKSRCWATPIRIRQQIQWLLSSTRRIVVNMRNEWRLVWNRALSISPNTFIIY